MRPRWPSKCSFDPSNAAAAEVGYSPPTPNSGYASRYGQEPKHVTTIFYLEGGCCEERTNDYQSGFEEHSSFSRELVRCVSENENSDHCSHEKVIGDPF